MAVIAPVVLWSSQPAFQRVNSSDAVFLFFVSCLCDSCASRPLKFSASVPAGELERCSVFSLGLLFVHDVGVFSNWCAKPTVCWIICKGHMRYHIIQSLIAFDWNGPLGRWLYIDVTPIKPIYQTPSWHATVFIFLLSMRCASSMTQNVTYHSTHMRSSALEVIDFETRSELAFVCTICKMQCSWICCYATLGCHPGELLQSIIVVLTHTCNTHCTKYKCQQHCVRIEWVNHNVPLLMACHNTCTD